MVVSTLRTAHGRGRTEPGRRSPAPGVLRLLQEFINTYNVEREHLGLPTEEFVTPAGLRRWLRRQGLWPRDARIRRADVRGVRRLREALRRVLLAHNGAPVDAAAVAVLRRAARAARLGVRVDAGGRMELAAGAPGLAGVLGRFVAAAFAAQRDGTWERLKACRRCRWAFYDRSRNRSGRWCAMSICGNRTKARAYRSRRHPDRRR
jgi:predicted RNA-binding Zn ribbon-like protein